MPPLLGHIAFLVATLEAHLGAVAAALFALLELL
jgi:hypothetical protein